MSKIPYTKKFFDDLRENTLRSARKIVPIVMDLINPKSVIDVGCGVGIWLAEFQKSGIDEFIGVDGEYIDPSSLVIPETKFRAVDLNKPFQLERRFDLVVCLEVAEHLPEDNAEQFMDSLTKLGNCILFSAAIPFQGGEDHLNEQWPEYWASLFSKKNYILIDYFRERIWNNQEVEWWYAQNMVLFIRERAKKNFPTLFQEFKKVKNTGLSLIHPRNYLHAIWMKQYYQALNKLNHVITPREAYGLIDDGMFGYETIESNAVLFLVEDGIYLGPPRNDDEAIHEIKRIQINGAHFIVFLWPAF